MVSISEFSRRKNSLFIFLTGIVLTNAVIAEIVGVKIFSVEALMGLKPMNIQLLGGATFDINLAAGVLNWPIVFITSDIINEYFGRPGVKKITYMTAGFIAYSFLTLFLATKLPAAPFWVEVNKGANNFDINYAFNNIFSQGLGIIIGSVVAFVVGQMLDVTIFQKLKKVTGNRFMWIRATGSTLFSQLIDSILVVFIAFYVFGKWNLTQVLNVALVGYIYKSSMAVILTPVLYLVHYAIDKYLGKDNARQLSNEALMAA